jgi:hypothetical protein
MLLPPRSRGRPPKTERPHRILREHPINHHVTGPPRGEVADRDFALAGPVEVVTACGGGRLQQRGRAGALLLRHRAIVAYAAPRPGRRVQTPEGTAADLDFDVTLMGLAVAGGRAPPERDAA